MPRNILAPVIIILFGFVARGAVQEPVRVACLGDSITQGAKVKAATESYPAQLREMLDRS